MNISRLAFTNILSKPTTTLLSLLLMSLGVGIISILLIINNHIDKQLDNNLRSIDMVVGAKGSPLQLILSSVYHLDKPTGNISYKEAKSLNKNVLVDFTIPLSYGDTYKGYRIVGTNEKYFDLYNLELSQGKIWESSMQAVLGSSLASNTNLKVGDKFFGTHGFDDQGRKFDHEGNMVNWWTEQDAVEYSKRTDVIKQQYANYKIEGENVNGELTLGENIADIGGLLIAHHAFVTRQKKNGCYKAEDEEKVFLAWARAWRTHMRKEAQLQRILTDPHSPAICRVNGVVKNIPAYYSVFNIKEGDEMYLEEKDRAAVW